MPPVRVLTFCGLLFTTVQNYSRQETLIERGGGTEGTRERRKEIGRGVGRRKGGRRRKEVEGKEGGEGGVKKEWGREEERGRQGKEREWGNNEK